MPKNRRDFWINLLIPILVPILLGAFWWIITLDRRLAVLERISTQMWDVLREVAGQ